MRIIDWSSDVFSSDLAVPWLNYFKIRASYGTVGNDRITSIRFPCLTKVNMGSGDVWGVNGIETIGETRIGAANLAWERAIKSNLGKIGRASCRERGCQYGSILVGAGSLKKNRA